MLDTSVIGYIVTAYAFTAIAIGGLIVWVVASGNSYKRQLRHLENQLKRKKVG